ncbi:hypothetical protein [Endozoicomonas lisbonensis]|uniref:Uncharacterized protein n=1 Tax=Endozoicomonas lisbonensis TaxID=3120522 RepID=A0ABV2SKW4_9GAMM
MVFRSALIAPLLFAFTFSASANSPSGIPTSLQGQKDALLLYASLLTPSDPSKTWITLTTEGKDGMGNFSYVMSFSGLLEKALPGIPLQRIMGGGAEKKKKVARIFGYPSKTSDFWFSSDPDPHLPTEMTEYSERVEQSQAVFSFVIAPPNPSDPPNDLDPLFDKDVSWMYFMEIHSPGGNPQIHMAHYHEMMASIPFGHQLTVEQSLSVYSSEPIEAAFTVDESEDSYLSGDYLSLDTPLAPSFGINKKNIGLLLNKKPEIPGRYSFKSAHALMPDGLSQAVDQLLKTDERLLRRQESAQETMHFYTGYFHSLYGKLLFIHSLAGMAPDADMMLMLPLNSEDLEIPAVVESLQAIPADRLHYWNGRDWQTIKQPDDNPLVTSASPKARRSIAIMNPFPLDREIYLELQNASGPVPVAGSTGDHSLYEVISSGRLPFHEYMPHQGAVNRDLAKVAGSPAIKAFFTAVGNRQRAKALQQLKQQPELVELFLLRLYQEYNATPFLIALVQQTLDRNSELWTLIQTADQRLEAETWPVKPATSDIEAIGYGRAIIRLLREMVSNEALTDSELADYQQRIDQYSALLLFRYPGLHKQLEAISNNIFYGYL